MDRMRFPFATPPRAAIEIGLLNNMPDAALHATERQFSRLLTDAAGPHQVRLRYYSLPEVPRGEHTRTYMDTLYGELDEMFDAGLDGLIVTGAEPNAQDLSDEPYWTRLTQVIDWARTNLHASYWSCLAAHAAVQHLDGVRRVRLASKCSGVFQSEPAGQDLMLAHLPSSILTPHSRLNGLDEGELARSGYTILTRSAEAGVDLFLRREPSLMVFCQGHPEYDADTLLREYCRDAGRYLCGKRDVQPDLPAHYLNLRTRSALEAAARRIRDPALMTRYNTIAAAAHPRKAWRASAVGLFRNWLGQIAASKTAAARAARRRPATAPAATPI
jgi:homoserine O-succinyltransferase/O-acetyltransferase